MITVFTSCYNQAEFLPAAIESVLAQTEKDFEYLLYDDGSADDTWDVIQGWAEKDLRIQPMRIPQRQGLGAAVNRSFLDAQGTSWVWAPADDVLSPFLLGRKVTLAHPYPDDVIYSHGRHMGTDHNVAPRERTPEEFREVCRTKSPIGFTGIWIPMSVFYRVGGFRTDLPYSEDFEWMLRACKAGVDFRCIPEVLYSKRKHPNSITGRHHKEILANIRKIRDEVGYG
jgi:glycosyltransferase involved in cell wall biosynthesis